MWDKQSLKVIPHTRLDVYKLSEIDKVQALLDESISNMSTIMGSRYVKGVEKIAKDWWARLNLYNDTIEQWKEFQRNWLYLDNILMSKEIR